MLVSRTDNSWFANNDPLVRRSTHPVAEKLASETNALALASSLAIN